MERYFYIWPEWWLVCDHLTPMLDAGNSAVGQRNVTQALNFSECLNMCKLKNKKISCGSNSAFIQH